VLGDGKDDVGARDAGAADAGAGDGDGVCFGEGDADGEGEADDSDGDAAGSSTTDCTGTGWFRELGLNGAGRVMAAAVAATTAIATPAVMAARAGLNRRNRRIRYTSVPCTAGGVPDGHSAASSRATSPRCDRPRSCQSGPYAPEAMVSSSVTKAAASPGRCRGCRPALAPQAWFASRAAIRSGHRASWGTWPRLRTAVGWNPASSSARLTAASPPAPSAG